MPHRAERKTTVYADPGGKEERCACRDEQNGRLPCMPRRAERKTAAHTEGRTGQDGSLPRILQATPGRKEADNDDAMLGRKEDDNDDATPGMKKDDNHDTTPGMKEDEHDE